MAERRLCIPGPQRSITGAGHTSLRCAGGLSPRSPVQVLWRSDPGSFPLWPGWRFIAPPPNGAVAWPPRPLNEQVAQSYERQCAGGVETDLTSGDVLACFDDEGGSKAFLHEVQGIIHSGQDVKVEYLTGDEARLHEPHLSARVLVGVLVKGQQYLTPSHYVGALARNVRARGGEILDNTPITAVERRDGTLVAHGPDVDFEAEAVVLANGAWLSSLASAHGVRAPVSAGRGYSFTVPCTEGFKAPTYFPSARVAVTPQGDRRRLAGIMEFGSPDAAPRRERIETMVRSVRPLLRGLDWAARSDDWMGPAH